MTLIKTYAKLKRQLEYKSTNDNWFFIFSDCESTNKAKNKPDDYKMDLLYAKAGNFPSEYDFYKKLCEYYDSGPNGKDADNYEDLKESISKFEEKFQLERVFPSLYQNSWCLIC